MVSSQSSSFDIPCIYDRGIKAFSVIVFCKGSKCLEDDVDGNGVENLRLKKLEIPEKKIDFIKTLLGLSQNLGDAKNAVTKMK